MLYIIYGDCVEENYVMRPELLFDGVYEYKWFDEQFVKDIIQDIDKSTVISPRLIDSPILGPIGPLDIAGGTKACILMKYLDDKIINASSCGDNCAKWIIEISKTKDLTIRLGYIMDFGDKPFDAVFLNTGDVIQNYNDFVDCVSKLEG